jgi:hypothetical protein
MLPVPPISSITFRTLSLGNISHQQGLWLIEFETWLRDWWCYNKYFLQYVLFYSMYYYTICVILQFVLIYNMYYFTICIILQYVLLYNVLFYSLYYFTICIILRYVLFYSMYYYTICVILQFVLFYNMYYFTICIISARNLRQQQRCPNWTFDSNFVPDNL